MKGIFCGKHSTQLVLDMDFSSILTLPVLESCRTRSVPSTPRKESISLRTPRYATQSQPEIHFLSFFRPLQIAQRYDAYRPAVSLFRIIFTTCPLLKPRYLAIGSSPLMRGSCVSFNLYLSSRVFFSSGLSKICLGTSSCLEMFTS